ncbi:MAG: Holliday junction resolvase RuvX [Ignavibacteriales bacterium]|nr:MAG: Holliday junction resolvase RuvX [Ignavibacteriales bacterium]
MVFIQLKDLTRRINNNGKILNEERILAIDFGTKRIGLAVTDPLNIFAYPLITLSNDSKFIEKLKKIIEEYHIVKIILGYPLKESGAESTSSLSVLKFKTELENKIDLKIELIDERYSSSIARERIIQSVVSKKKRRDKSLLDKNAAAVILEDYLNTIKK